MSKPLGKPIARPAISEEEKKAQVERFLAQKRESFAINILDRKSTR